MKFQLLKTFINLKPSGKNLKKILLILNTAIFLSIFAISASAISIYLQFKINKIDANIKTYEVTKQFVDNATMQIPEGKKVLSDMLNFTHLASFYNNILLYSSSLKSISGRETYFLPIKTLYQSYPLIKSELESLSGIEQEYSKVGWTKILNQKLGENFVQNFDKSVKKIYQTIEQNYKIILEDTLLNPDNNMLSEKNTIIPKVLNGITYYEIDFSLEKEKKYREVYHNTRLAMINLEIAYDDVIAMSKVLSDTYSESINYEKNQITKINNNKSNIILIAFFLQLIAFLFSQYFEIQSIRDEGKNEKST